MQQVVRRAMQLGVLVVLTFGAVAAEAACDHYPSPDVYVFPSQPRADQPVTISAATYGTIYYDGIITLSGHRIDIWFQDLWRPQGGGDYPPQCLPDCTGPFPGQMPPPWECISRGRTFAQLAPGTYEVYVYGNLGATFVVAPPPAVPAIGSRALALLAVLLVLSGAIVLRP